MASFIKSDDEVGKFRDQQVKKELEGQVAESRRREKGHGQAEEENFKHTDGVGGTVGAGKIAGGSCTLGDTD